MIEQTLPVHVEEMTRYYLRLAYGLAAQSPDPSTQNGAVLVSASGEIIGQAYNRFPEGVLATSERLADRAQKYPRTRHAELGSILDAVKNGRGHLIPGSTLYCPWFACETCAIAILSSGIATVVGHAEHPGRLALHSKWVDSVPIGMAMLDEAGFLHRWYSSSKSLGAPAIRVNYEAFQP